uniref:Transposase n=1 Tax=Aromatoleum buckelii TaxID=200254 RepID=A0ABX1N5X2_9RHOO
MERMPRGVSTQEFREQAVKLVESEGLSMREVARRLSIPIGSMKNWVNAARAGKLNEVGQAQKPLTDLEMELARVRKELAEVKLERGLLKNHLSGAPSPFWTETARACIVTLCRQ